MRYYSSTAQPMAITGALTSSTLTMGVNAVSGLPTSTPFTLVIDPGLASEEIVTVTSVAGLTLTIIRGEDGSAAQPHTTGALVRHMVTARDLREPQVHFESSLGVHGIGPSNAVVGTATVQTLSGKAISGASNTLTNIPQSAIVGLASSLGALATADSTEATSRAAADSTLQSNINAEIAARQAASAATLQAASPTGCVTAWAGTTGAPAGWLWCNGAEVSRTTYAALFAAVGTTYGAGNGSTTFNLPNLVGRTVVMQDPSQTEFNTPGRTGGAKTHTLSVAEMPSHGHGMSDPGHWHGPQMGLAWATWQGNGNIWFSSQEALGVAYTGAPAGSRLGLEQGTPTAGSLTGIAIHANGGNGAHNNLQPYITLNYIIKA